MATHRTRRPTLVHAYTATPATIAHLVVLVTQANPSWEPGLVQIVLADLAPRVDGSDLAIAAIRAATAPNLPGPKAIGWRGPHWRDLATTPPEISTRQPRCAICGRVESDCYGIRPGADDHEFEPTTVTAYR